MADVYYCPICGVSVPVVSDTLQALGLVRSNHLRSHGINTYYLTREQKRDARFLRAYFVIHTKEVKTLNDVDLLVKNIRRFNDDGDRTLAPSYLSLVKEYMQYLLDSELTDNGDMEKDFIVCMNNLIVLIRKEVGV